jgi:hypothetical protein
VLVSSPFGGERPLVTERREEVGIETAEGEGEEEGYGDEF